MSIENFKFYGMDFCGIMDITEHSKAEFSKERE